ncbi:alpha/beta hydrolase [Streptosporangium sp. NBC_01756]|uniref:alpha/beta hydrolase n=1 Tax=Streptosporangium sp. NBC_01756 TaxID=2975950 RepID=UPI002DD7AA4D|nr:alpha/beta hydrolase [Streptosporangium sp. NBC_01756]WSC88747.1 alpha/beta hydrolase [Streptosporangium sp. NBC_01756]
MADDARPTFHLPARDIAVPTSVSPEAQAVLARGIVGPPYQWPPAAPLPAIDDVDGWREMIAAQQKAMLELFGEALTSGGDGVEEIDLGGFPVYKVTPEGVSSDDRRVYLDIHGGSWTLGGGQMCRAVAAATAALVGARVWSVDYRMPPDHRFPVALDDCLAAYRALLQEHRPEEIIIGGVSSGGNLAAALILRARDEGLPLPAAAMLSTPATDLTMSGDTWQTNLGLDIVLTASLMPAILLYADGHDLRDPYLSPVFGDLTKGFPPTILLSGTRDLLLSDTIRMHRALRAADVPAELHVFEAAGHGVFLGQAPEDRDHAREIRRFVDEHWAAASRS